jgi:hypothetical protein
MRGGLVMTNECNEGGKDDRSFLYRGGRKYSKMDFYCEDMREDSRGRTSHHYCNCNQYNRSNN